jgi:hypothetical protein
MKKEVVKRCGGVDEQVENTDPVSVLRQTSDLQRE